MVPAQEPSIEKIYIDYLDTEGSSLHASLNGKPIEFRFDLTETSPSITLFDTESQPIASNVIDNGQYLVAKEGYEDYLFKIIKSENLYYLQLIIDEENWNFFSISS